MGAGKGQAKRVATSKVMELTEEYIFSKIEKEVDTARYYDHFYFDPAVDTRSLIEDLKTVLRKSKDVNDYKNQVVKDLIWEYIEAGVFSNHIYNNSINNLFLYANGKLLDKHYDEYFSSRKLANKPTIINEEENTFSTEDYIF